MEPTTVHGTRVLGTRGVKKPVVHTNTHAERVCNDKWCDKILSQYNKGPFCYAHQPTKYPRLRGHK